MLNLLVSIISDIHAETKDAGEKTRLYEMTNILVDTNFALITKIAKYFIIKPNNGLYLIQLYNEKHETQEEKPNEVLEKSLAALEQNITQKMNAAFEKEFEKIQQYLIQNFKK